MGDHTEQQQVPRSIKPSKLRGDKPTPQAAGRGSKLPVTAPGMKVRRYRIVIFKKDARIRIEWIGLDLPQVQPSMSKWVELHNIHDFFLIDHMIKSAETVGYEQRNVKPQFAGRDAEIVRLYREGMPAKQIHATILKNPDWAKARRGKQVSLKAVRDVIQRSRDVAKQ